MNIVFLLHFYQPINQHDDILDRIVNESYRPLLKGLLSNPDAKINANVSGVLTKLLAEKGYTDVLEMFKSLIKSGQIELTSSAMYHPLLPLLPKNECIRQIELNEAENKKHFGDLYQPKGFFPPEMAVNDMIFDLAAEKNYSWLAAPTISCKDTAHINSKHFKYKDTNLTLLYRSMVVSSIILSAQVKSAQELLDETKDLDKPNTYWFSVMDAETFGHHRIGHERVLFDILTHPQINSVLGSKIDDLGLEVVKDYDPLPGTWTNEEQDKFLEKEGKSYVPFVLWQDPTNPIHTNQWELLNLLLNSLNEFQDKNHPNYEKARQLADYAIASDQFWWASGNPWWSLEMIELGAFEVKKAINTLVQGLDGSKFQEILDKSVFLYNKIIEHAFDWQRSGYIRQKHIDYSKTKLLPPLQERTNPEWYNQLVLEFEYEMNKATQTQNFEKAIKWRDAVLKISLGVDKFDILHVVDELWLGRNLPWATPVVKPFLEHNWDEFSDFAKAHFLNCKNREEFENWKSSKS